MNESERNGLFSQAGQPGADAMSCVQARRQIEHLIEDCDLGDVERALLMAHVRGCVPCKAELESLRRLETRLRDTFVPLDTAPRFNARLMAALPDPASADAPDWERKRQAAATRLVESGVEAPRRDVNVLWRRLLRRSSLTFVGVAALLTFFIGLAYVMYGKPVTAGPTVADVHGACTRMPPDGEAAALMTGDVLAPNDTLATASAPAKMALRTGPRNVGRLALAPKSKLQVLDWHSYILLAGSAYFEVHKGGTNLPAGEAFEVNAGGLATVRVTGTVFGVDMAAAGFGGVLVFVKEGTVKVRARGAGDNELPVSAGHELVLAPGGGVTIRETGGADHTPWLAALAAASGQKPGTIAAAVKPQPNVPPPAAVPPTAPPRRAPRWDVAVKDVQLLGKNLSEGIDALADVLDKPPELAELREQAQGPLINNAATLSFSVHNEMPLQAALRWMARDVSWRFAPGADSRTTRFVTAAGDELPGPAASGVPPEDVRRALDAPFAENTGRAISLPALAESLAARCGLTIVLDRALVEQHLAAARTTNLDLPGQTVAQKLDALLAALHAGIAWYDNALYIAAPSRIEALTRVDRRVAPGPQLLGQPLNPRWAQSLRDLVAQQTYPLEQAIVASPWLSGVRLHGDAALAGRPVVSGDVNLDANPAAGPELRYHSGLLGEAVMGALLNTLQAGSPPVAGTAALLSQPVPSGAVPDIESLAKQAQSLRVDVAPGAKPQSFTKLAFVAKNQRLGEAIEWAAWLSGCGLRQAKNDVWVVDDVAACYGPPALRVVSLASLAEQQRGLALDLPQIFTGLLSELHPTFFAGTQFTVVGQRVVFAGDRRQLLLAQRLRTAFEAGGPATAQEAQNWKPASRLALEKNLAEPFQATPGAASPKLSGSFVGLLRQGALSSQLRSTLLVDPAAMRDKASLEVPEFDATGLTVGKVIERLAKAAGLKMVLEGDVVWLRP